MHILGLGKNVLHEDHVSETLGVPYYAKIPHLHAHKAKPVLVIFM